MVKGSRRTAMSIFATGAWLLLGLPLSAQQPAPRITAEIGSAERVTLRGSHAPMAKAENENGRVSADMRLEGIGIVFSRPDAQEKDLQELIAAQQNPASPQYHQWLTPEQFGARFGLADADITAVQNWLMQQGFTVDEVARSKNHIRFSGTVRQAEQAFGTELHYYNVSGERHFAPHGDLALPASLAAVVQAVTNLNTFRPRSHIVRKDPQAAVQYHFTSGQTGNHFLTPKDLATIYNISPAYSAGLNGSGQSIAVVGQSEIVMADIEHFQTAAGFSIKDPIRKFVPNSGTATIVTGDESESDLDLEYASTMAPGATIYFYYTGNNSNFNVWNSIETAVTDNLAQIISSSYGVCEPLVPQAFYNSLNGTFLAQAAAQGQTVISAAGDGGSTDCSGATGASTAQQQALSVDFPASSQYVTGVGGTEFPAADVASGNSTYFSSNGNSDVTPNSALSYIPEQVWNDNSTGNISAGGGGISTLTPRATWQAGVTGIPSGTFRLVPDISLSTSPNNAGYLYCSSDSSTKITGSCANGFRDTNSTNLTVAGGTSFGAPIFAGMIAIINQKMGSRQGMANTKLYSLAANSSTYASAFHDTINGNNNCSAAGATACPTTIPAATNYSATTGYDLASGLGSVNFNGLLTAWSGSTATTGSFTLAATNVTIAAGGTGTSTVTVTPQNGYAGTVAWTVSSSPSSADVCFAMTNLAVSGTSAVTASLTIKTSASACGTGAIVGSGGKRQFAALTPRILNNSSGPTGFVRLGQSCVALVGILLIGFGRRRYLRLSTVGCSLLLLVAGMVTAGCSSSASGSGGGGGGGNAAKGNYTVTITGTDTATSSITASTTMTLTVD